MAGDTVVVGAYGEERNAIGVNGNQSDNSPSGSGGAYVFVRSGTNWIRAPISRQFISKTRSDWALQP